MRTITQLIDEALIRPDRVRSGKWNPSSFGGCYRKQFWNRKDEPKSNPINARTLRVFKMGELVEKFVCDAICEAEPSTFERQVLCESEDVYGIADLDSKKNDEVADIKSQHSKAFWCMAKFKGDDIKEEKYSNWLQVGYYARELKRQFMRLVFVSKDDLCIQEYVQPLDEYWRKQIEVELTALRYLWKQNKLPPALPRCKPNAKGEFWECQYCGWQIKCAEIEKNNKK